ncbi:hypothetical protein ACH3XW_29445 [Acanthocheilonema viteae]|uniref:Ubiquitin-like protease family profile domain-containing protein n=1 Tax=Acanthocheilonema viteae TaxID=6277 RepID=A0A498S9Q7_ACAVI|nr:unnamed protein product [Acanthocheilonema viteae]
MRFHRENGNDKLVNLAELSEEEVSTPEDREEVEVAEEIEAMSHSGKSEKLEMDEFKSAKSDISDSDTAGPHTSDKQHNDEENFKQNEENFKEIDIQMGKRLADDIIDAYCDKLQESVDKEVDGMLAMQYILLEPNSIKNLIKGDKNICQVIYDHCRAHYLVLFRNKLNPKRIIVYDPIVPQEDSVIETLNDSVREQILAIFGHLYQDDEIVEIAVETGLSTQNDCWSCGLRSVAFTTHLLLGINPVNYEYDLEKVGKFTMEIIKMDRPDRKVIASGEIGQERKENKSCLTIVRVTKGDKFAIENGTACVINNQSSVESLLDNENEVNISEEKLSELACGNDDRNNDNNNNDRKDGRI